MKTVILAGGLGSRISEESHLLPKPMIEIGGKPILWHILKIYQSYGYNDFIICLGYKGYIIKEYFINYFIHNSDITVDLSSNEIHTHRIHSEDLKVTLVDTGFNTKTAGRLYRIREYIKDERFMMTYGDGVSDINISDLVRFHERNGKLVTVTSVQPKGKFGIFNLANDGQVIDFIEKPSNSGAWINGGFFVMEPGIFNYLDETSDTIMWEEDPLHKLTEDNELIAFKHKGFWKSMDILRDKMELETLWLDDAPWKKWN